MASLDIKGIGASALTEYAMQESKNASAIALQKKLENTAKSQHASDDELWQACKSFESYFLEQVFKQMAKTVNITGDGDKSTANLVDFFKDNTIAELATQSTETNSLGLAQMLYEQMKRNIGEE